MQDQHEFHVNKAFDTALPPGALNDLLPPAPSFEVPDYSALAETALPPLVGEMFHTTVLPTQIEQPQASVIPA